MYFFLLYTEIFGLLTNIQILFFFLSTIVSGNVPNQTKQNLAPTIRTTMRMNTVTDTKIVSWPCFRSFFNCMHSKGVLPDCVWHSLVLLCFALPLSWMETDHEHHHDHEKCTEGMFCGFRWLPHITTKGWPTKCIYYFFDVAFDETMRRVVVCGFSSCSCCCLFGPSSDHEHHHEHKKRKWGHDAWQNTLGIHLNLSFSTCVIFFLCLCSFLFFPSTHHPYRQTTIATNTVTNTATITATNTTRAKRRPTICQLGRKRHWKVVRIPWRHPLVEIGRVNPVWVLRIKWKNKNMRSLVWETFRKRRMRSSFSLIRQTTIHGSKCFVNPHLSLVLPRWLPTHDR